METEKYNKKTNKTPNETEKNLEVERKKYFKLMIDKIKYGSLLSDGILSLKNDFSYGTNKVTLKLKEISYIYTESFAAGELKHGTIALIEDGTPVFVIATQERLYEKIISN